MVPQEARPKTRPLPGEAPLNVLIALPSGDFSPASFIEGSRQLMEATAERMISTYQASQPDISEEWQKWIQEVAPQSDDAQDYVRNNGGVVNILPVLNGLSEYAMNEGAGVYVPFKSRIFGGTGVSETFVGPRLRGNQSNSRGISMRVVEPTTCVLHSGHRNAAAKSTPSRVVVMNADGTTPSEPIASLNNVYEGRAARRENVKKKTVRVNVNPTNNSNDSEMQIPTPAIAVTKRAKETCKRTTSVSRK